MATEEPLRRIALSLPGVTETPHFDRRAFRRRIIFTSLAADGSTANLLLPVERQADLIDRFPHVLRRVGNKWGDRGWTRIDLTAVDANDLECLVTIAFEAAR